MDESKLDGFLKNPKKALLMVSLPILVGNLVQLLYNIVDTAYIGRLGADAIAALTFSFPLFFIMISLNAGLGIGMSSRVSRYLGERQKEMAENTAMHGIAISLILAAVIFTLGFIFIRPIFVLFGATPAVVELAVPYMLIVLAGIFFQFPTMVINSIFSSQGDTKIQMKIQIAGLVLNIILDPIFIYTFKLGVAGAAIATSISFLFAFILSVYFLKRESYLKVSRKAFVYSSLIVKSILKVGAPATVMMLMMSIYNIVINRLMSGFGVEYVAAYGLVARIDSVATMPVVALSFGLLPLVGMFYGAKRYDLIKKIFWYSMKAGMVFVFCVCVLYFIFPTLLLRIFTSDAALLELGSALLGVQLFSYPFMVVTVMVSRAMQGIGRGFPGLIVNMLRLLIVAGPLAFILVRYFNVGYMSAPIALIIGGIVAGFVALVWMEVGFRKLLLE
ncbi:MAG: MATE family efflux transporter [Candidatus Woesearchaeota archaeon]